MLPEWRIGQNDFTTKHLHTQYRVSSGQNMWLLCPLVPEGIIKFSVMPSGKISHSSRNKTQIFQIFFSNDQKNELDSNLHDKILGYHF